MIRPVEVSAPNHFMVNCARSVSGTSAHHAHRWVKVTPNLTERANSPTSHSRCHRNQRWWKDSNHENSQTKAAMTRTGVSAGKSFAML